MPAYSPLSTLRHIDNALLAEYAKRYGLFEGLDIEKLKQTEVEPIYEAICLLPPETREKVEADLRKVAGMSEKRQIQQLFSALAHYGHSTPEFKKKRAYHDKALWALLEYPELFEKVLLFSLAFTQGRYWQRFEYTPGQRPRLATQDILRLEKAIREYFNRYDGRGDLCKVEPHSFLGKEYLFAYPSDYPQEVIEWMDDGTFDRHTYRLAFMVIFVFVPGGSWVDIYVEEPISVKRELFSLWAGEIMGLNDVDTRPKRSYNLTPFYTRNHDLQIPAESPVKEVTVRNLRFSPSHNPTAIYDIHTDTSQNKQSIYDEMEDKQLGIASMKKVGLELTIQDEATGRVHPRRVDISPSSVSLKHEDEDGMIRQFLKAVGIDATI